MSLTLAQLQARLGGELRDDDGRALSGVGSLEHATSDQLSFALGEKQRAAAQASQAGALIVGPAFAEGLDRPRLVVANPHASFARAIGLFHPEPPLRSGHHPSAVVAASAVIADDVEIGPHVCIGEQVHIGPGCRIGPGCVIGDGVRLGAGCRLYANVTIYAGCVIGDRAGLHAGCVIGADGFGLAWEDAGWVKVPQIGRVILGDDVEIGANTTIDRGALDDTVIGRGVKIDNLVQLAHNCRVGDHTAIAGCAGIAGSTTIGQRCLIGGAAMILGHIEIGDGVTVSGASFIGKSISTPGVYTSTQPQMPHADWIRNAAQLRHLADMRERIRALEKQLREKDEDKES
ncbi:MAG: UDP-3-O-(3-hydroxymyristoyl)glucosamine N-acyltransferase [Pseudomonadota bacterium]